MRRSKRPAFRSRADEVSRSNSLNISSLLMTPFSFSKRATDEPLCPGSIFTTTSGPLLKKQALAAHTPQTASPTKRQRKIISFFIFLALL